MRGSPLGHSHGGNGRQSLAAWPDWRKWGWAQIQGHRAGMREGWADGSKCHPRERGAA